MAALIIASLAISALDLNCLAPSCNSRAAAAPAAGLLSSTSTAKPLSFKSATALPVATIISLKSTAALIIVSWADFAPELKLTPPSIKLVLAASAPSSTDSLILLISKAGSSFCSTYRPVPNSSFSKAMWNCSSLSTAF